MKRIFLLLVCMVIWLLPSCVLDESSDENHISNIADSSWNESVSVMENSELVDDSEIADEASHETDTLCEDGHIFSPWEILKEATCIEKGILERKCQNCEFVEQSELAKSDHSQKAVEAVEPTCDTEGYTEGVICTFCNMIFSGREIIPPKGHVFVFSETVAPTCSVNGYSLLVCFCGENAKTNFLPTIEHTYEKIVVDSDCVSEGYTLHQCSACEYSYKDEFTPIKHEYKKTVIASTCTEQGYNFYECKLCGDSYKDEFTPIKHEYKKTVIASTCTEQGYDFYECKLCGHSYKDGYTPIAHTYEETVTPPTCTKQGYTLHKCKFCEESYMDKYTPASHLYKKTVTAPTCTAQGYTTYDCTACGDSYKDDYTPEAHKYKETVVSPSCVETGYTLYKCISCGNSYRGEETPKTAHSYVGKVSLPTIIDQGYTEYMCSSCGDSYTGDFTEYSSIFKNAYAGNSKVLAQGIDVSRWNHQKDSDGNYIPLDWASIKKAGIDFVIIKAGSTVGIDPVFEMNYEGAKKAGLDVGAYFYTYAMNANEAIEDAEMFISFIKGKTFEYPLYMDFEDSSQRDIASSVKTEMVRNFCVTLQRAGYYVGLYTGYYWMNPRFNIMDGDAVINMVDMWFAHIVGTTSVGVSESFAWDPSVQLNHSEFGMWQYSHSGVISGISHCDFDFNFAYKDYPSIIKKLGLNGYSSTEQTKEYVWVIVQRLNVRTYWDTSTSSNILNIANYGDCFEVIEKNNDYVKIYYNGTVAYISADPEHVSFTKP